jgi:putative DNA primase/helicase
LQSRFSPRACDITVTPTQWLWTGYLAEGALAILDGDPGQGKSMLTLDLAARLSTGRAWPDDQSNPGPAPVWISQQNHRAP